MPIQWHISKPSVGGTRWERTPMIEGSNAKFTEPNQVIKNKKGCCKV